MATEKSPPFGIAEWNKVRRTLADDPGSYGLPQRVYGSVVLGSFNIRKLGKLATGSKHERDVRVWSFLADVCRHFDLLAVQEVMSSTEGIRHLRELMGPEYGLIVSDTTGALPGGGGGMPERSAFLYNRAVVRRTELVTDVTYDRFEVLDTLVREFPGISREVHAHRKAMTDFERAKAAGEKAKKPKLKMPSFLSFVRTPFAVGFEVQGFPRSEVYPFLAVCAHLLYGDSPEDRQREGAALIKWMMGKARARGTAPMNLVLFGDLNLDYDKPIKDLERIAATVAVENKKAQRRVQMSFPFLFAHPQTQQTPPPKGDVFRTNAALNQTFDQIGILTTDKRLKKRLATTPTGHAHPEVWGVQPEGPDYGVFNFSELFSRALKGKPFAELAGKEKSEFVRRYDFRVSDHMPIWYRFPLPRFPKGVDI
ncbi:MAG: endonuclease/exonuclease/phosphatase [Thermoanaerobaculia bacterium]